MSFSPAENPLSDDITLENGSISGKTDYFTSKFGSNWTANVTVSGKIDYCIINIYLPSEATIKDVDCGEMDKSIGIIEDDLKVTAQGWNITNPYVIIRYELTETDEEKEDYNEFLKMNWTAQNKIVQRYTKEITGLKFKNHK